MASRSRQKKKTADALDVIEQAYKLDASPADWLRGLAQMVYTHLGQGLGISAFYYRVTDDNRVETGDEIAIDLCHTPPMPVGESLAMLPPDFVQQSFVKCECITQSAALDQDPSMRELMKPMLDAAASVLGWRDIAMLGGMDPTGHGVYFGAWLPHETRLDTRVREMWSRVAVHIATAHRLRRTLAALSSGASANRRPDAVLYPDGRVAHAEGEAVSQEARDALRNGVRLMEVARGDLRRDKPFKAVDAWRGLVSCRWSLLDQFESDGKRYVIARRNDARINGFAALTDRERQAVSYAALNHTNKLIAYEIGISPSTVGVLLHRATRKMGVTSRRELIEVFLSQRPATS